jgi:hypothetical protein
MARSYQHASRDAKARRSKQSLALARPELRVPTTPRAVASGVTSMAIKVLNPELQRLRNEFLARRRAS